MRTPLLIAGSLLLISACRKDEPVGAGPGQAILRIDVVPEWEGQPFTAFTEYRAPGNYRFQAEMLRMYLSDLRLVNASDEQVLEQVRLLDLGTGPKQFELIAPEGEWLGLRSGIGLPHDLNYSNTSLFDQDHPMSVNTGMYWSWATGYKFVLFDGRYDPDPLGTGALLAPFSVHTGMDTCFTEVDLFPALPFSTALGTTTSLTLRVDVSGFLLNGPDTINVTTENQSHGGNLPLALKLTRNVRRSMRIE
ncbi:MAG: hypothetical protein IPM46_03430 [Flavobacteriales bacterium]|nr:hypothetical protein [Flavobacteriales bacterium]